MPVLELEPMLADIAADAPCGLDLAYDPAYLELQRLGQGTPEQQIGDTITPAEEPNWRDLRERAADLWTRSKDLRVLLYLTLADLKLSGLPGLAAGLEVLNGLIEQHWEGLYPRLDPDDANDPTERLNIISALAASPETFGDPMMFQRRTQESPLTDSRQLGRFSLRDLQVARGELSVASASGAAPPTTSVIDAAFEDTSVEFLQEIAGATDRAIASLGAISKALDGRVGLGNAPSLRSYETLLAGIRKELAARLAARGAADGGGAGDADGAGSFGDAPPAQSGGAGPSISGEIRSPKDVVLALDKLIRYYKQAEVSSPVPLFIRAAHKLVSKDFLEINRILTSDVVRQVEEIANHGEQTSE